MKDLYSTYSICAMDSKTGEIGIAVQTHQTCVGSVVPWLEPGVGAVATQALVNIDFGPMGLSLLRQGLRPEQVIDALCATDPGRERRQIGVLSAEGEVSAFTGDKCIAEAGHLSGEGFCVQANMMDSPGIPEAMAEAFTESSGELSFRMLAALRAAQKRGGDIRGMQSAALKIVPGERSAKPWDGHYDMRVDENEGPLDELERLLYIIKAQSLSNQGDKLLEQGSVKEALDLWKEARALAPEQTEIGFWQAVSLADSSETAEYSKEAAAILRESLRERYNMKKWLDLIRRLEDCGMIKYSEAVRQMISRSGLR